MSTPKTRAARPQPGVSRPARGRPWLVGSAIGLALVVVIGAAAALLAYFGWGGGSDDAGTSAPPEIAHVHGLGADPADGTLYAATHYGMFRLPEDGAPTRVADRVQDFMGFTVAGPGRFLASGHPAEGQDGPSSVGLIESTDAGQTWQPVSLAGEADFHALEYRHDRVYGYNAITGQFLVSEDKKTWQERIELPMADFTVSPEDPDVVLATTEQGLARSSDGGESFEVVPQAPLLVLVSWAADGTLVGISPEGAVQVSSDSGVSWEERGAIEGSPEALTAQSGDEIYAAAGGEVLVSTDGGREFTTRYPA